MSETSSILPIPEKFDGRVLRSSSIRAEESDSITVRRVGIDPQGGTLLVERIDSKGEKTVLGPVEEITLRAILIPATGKERTELLLYHPADRFRLIGLVLDDLDPDLEASDDDPGPVGEVDGVWIAEGGGIEDPDS
ncbi:MAG: hypothetical protein AAF725_17940 [Acidobacteriota bacterium]